MTKTIDSRAELVERLKDVLAVEIKARASYAEDIVTFRNFLLLDRLRRIALDEERHIRMLRDLILFLGGDPDRL